MNDKFDINHPRPHFETEPSNIVPATEQTPQIESKEGEPSDEYQGAYIISNIFEKSGKSCLLVGGAVRDMHMGITPKDFDLATDATPAETIALIEHTTQDTPTLQMSITYPEVSQAYQVGRIRYAGHEYEIATFRTDHFAQGEVGRHSVDVKYADTIEEDLGRRDFTCNAIAHDMINNCSIDPYEGIKDIDDRILRFVGDPWQRIKEDPLRLLRATRLRNKLGFDYEEATHKALKQAVRDGVLEDISVERVSDELNKMLAFPKRTEAIADLDELGMLERLLPEFCQGKGVPQPPEFHSEGDVFTHQMLVISNLPDDAPLTLVWAAILHDVGKSRTFSHEQGDRIRFNGHSKAGAEIARDILHRLRIPKAFTEDVVWMIEHHMDHQNIAKMSPHKQNLLFGHHCFQELCQLFMADAAAALRPNERGELEGRVVDDLPMIEKLYQQYKNRPPDLKQQTGIDGNTLRELGVPKGPRIGEILNQLTELHASLTVEGIDDSSIKQRLMELAKKLSSE